MATAGTLEHARCEKTCLTYLSTKTSEGRFIRAWECSSGYTRAIMAKPGGKRKRKKKTSGLYLSIMVIHRIEDAMSLVSSIKSYQKQLVQGLAGRFSRHLRPGETLPDYHLALELAVRDVRAALDLLVDLDDRVAFARSDQLSSQVARSTLVREELYPRTVAVRGEIDLAFGRQRGGWLHGMRGRTRRSPPALEAQLRRAVDRLAHPDRKLPKLKNRYAVVDRDRWLRQLRPLYLELAELSKKIDLGRHAVPALTAEKNAAMGAYDLSYRDALRLAKAAFAAAGLDGTPIRNLKPYYQRRRMSAQARKKRQARAAAKVPERTVEEAAPPKKVPDRVAVPKSVVKWLEANRRLVGT